MSAQQKKQKRRKSKSDDTPENTKSSNRNKKWLRRSLLVFICMIAVWLLGDFVYSRYVAGEVHKWESKVQWDENGLQPGAQEFNIGNGPVALLMVHGFSDSPQIYRKIAPQLAENGYTCRGILLPGFGRTIQDYADANRNQWLQKIDQEIQDLQKTHSSIIIVAHSLGGAVTINHLLQEPNCVDGVVLIAPAIDVSNERSPLASTRFWHEFSKWTLPFSNIAKSPFELDVRDEVERHRPNRNKFTPRSVVDNTFALMDENRKRASEIKLPLLMFVSPTDLVINPASIKSYFDEWGGAPKKLVTLNDSGHMIPIDVEWETVQREINEFANSVALGTGK